MHVNFATACFKSEMQRKQAKLFIQNSKHLLGILSPLIYYYDFQICTQV